MKNMRRFFCIAIAMLAVMMLMIPVASAEPDPAEDVPTQEEVPTEETPSEDPPPSETTSTEPTPPPVETPTPDPTVEPTPPPTESAGSVDVIIFVYANGSLADGYRMQIDQSTTDAKDGQWKFPGVTVESHSIAVISSDGGRNEGTLSMSRGDSTGMTGASGGDYSISVARDAGTVYMNVLYEEGGAINITSVANQQVAAPSASPSASASASAISGSGTFSIVSEYVDSDGEPIAGLGAIIALAENAANLGMDDINLTNGSGRYTMSNAGYGSYYFGMGEITNGLEGATLLSVNITQGQSTRIASSTDEGYVVETPMTTQELYFKFRQVGSGFVLDEVSDEVPGAGISSLIIGIIVVAVIVVVVIVVLNVLKKRRKNKRPPQKPGSGYREYEPEDDDDFDEVVEPARRERPRQRTTGGNNKFSDRSRF
jgi:hypothetical protein